MNNKIHSVKTEKVRKSKNYEITKISDNAKDVLTYFINSLSSKGYIIPDSFNREKDIKGYYTNITSAEYLVEHADIAKVKKAIDICHSRLHSFWGNKCPVFSLSSLKKAYNYLLAEGLLDSSTCNEYGKSEYNF